MAKCRIGHFAEAQVLESLGVDYIDESEVLTPADEAHHVDKWAFTVAVRLRRDQPRRGAAPHLRGRVHDPLQGRGRHRQHRRGGPPPPHDPRRHQEADRRRGRRALRAGPRSCWRRPTSSRRSPSAASCPVPLFCAGGIATPADASLVMQLGAQAVFVGSRHLQERRPDDAGQGDRRGDHALRRPRDRRQGVARARPGDEGRGDREPRRQARRPWLVADDRAAPR